MQQLEAYIRLFQGPTISEPPVLSLAGPDAVRDAISPPVMEQAEDALYPTTSEPPVLSLAGPDAVRDAMSPPVMEPAEDAFDRHQPSATSFSFESNEPPCMIARTMAMTNSNKKSNVTPATPAGKSNDLSDNMSLADPTLGDDRDIETYISCIVPLLINSETLCALKEG